MQVRPILLYVAGGVLSVIAAGAAVPTKVDLSTVDLVGVPQVIEFKPPLLEPEYEVIAGPTPLPQEEPESQASRPRAPWPFEVDAQRAGPLAEMILALEPRRERWLASEVAYYTAKFTRNARHIAEVPAEVFISLLYEESHFRPEARGAAGEIGMAQVLPSTARSQGYDVARLQWDVMYQVECGVTHLAGCIREAGGDVREGLARYNGGPTPGGRSYAYADRVIQRAARFRSAASADVPR